MKYITISLIFFTMFAYRGASATNVLDPAAIQELQQCFKRKTDFHNFIKITVVKNNEFTHEDIKKNIDLLNNECLSVISNIGGKLESDFKAWLTDIESELDTKRQAINDDKQRAQAAKIITDLKKLSGTVGFPAIQCSSQLVDFDSRISALLYGVSRDQDDIADLNSYLDNCMTAMSDSKIKNADRKMLLTKVEAALDNIQTSLLNIKLFKQGDDGKFQNIKLIQAKLQRLKGTLSDKVSFDRGWVDQIYNSFYIGYEGTSFQSIQTKGTSRFGFMIYHQLSGIKEDTAGDYGFEWMWPHIFLNLVSTSTAEQSGKTDNTVKSALELDFNIYWPWYLVKQDGGRVFTWGPIATRGWRKFDDGTEASNNFTDKHYAGIRLAHSSEMYFDLLRGTTENVTGNRYEFRGQMPLLPFYAGRIYGGLILNVSAHGDYADDKSDSLRIYAIWSASIEDMFK